MFKKKNNNFLGLFVLSAITLIFFWKFFFRGLIPFPGDLLLAEYQPWRSMSFSGYVSGSIPHKAQYPDTLRQLYPWKTLAIKQLKQLELPLWNPYNFSGTPLLANFQSAPFYPLNIFYFFLPQTIAWGLLAACQLWLSVMFTYLYLSKIKLGFVPAVFGAVAYTYGGYNAVWLEYNTIGQVICWLPLSLLALEHLSEKSNKLWSSILLFSLTFSLLAGHPQIFFYVWIISLSYYLYRKTKPLNWGVLFCFFLPFGLAAFQLFPGLELIQNSARSSHDYNFLINKILMQPYQLIMLLIPDFFGNPVTRNYLLSDTYIGKIFWIGLVPWLFLAWVVFKEKINRFFTFLFIIFLILLTNNPLSQIIYKIPLPFFSSSSPTLASFLISFALAVLTASGLEKFLQNQKMNRLIVILLILTCLLWLPNLNSVSKKQLLYGLAIVLTGTGLVVLIKSTLLSGLKTLFIIGLLLLQFFELNRFFLRFNPFVDQSWVFPRTEIMQFLQQNAGINRFWGYGTAAIDNNFATQYALYSTDGYDPLYPRDYGQLIQASKNGQIPPLFTTQTRSDANLAPGFGETDLSTNAYRLKLMDLLGVKYVLDRQENLATERTFSPERFKLVYEKDTWKIYENLKALPRIYLATDYQVYANEEEFSRIFFAENFDPRKTILVEESLPLINNSTLTSSLELVNYHPNRVKLTVDSNGGYLVLTDNYYPGWEATIDGKITKIYKADYAFRAVAIPPGIHLVEFRYHPLSFRWGIIVSGLSILIGIGYLIKRP